MSENNKKATLSTCRSRYIELMKNPLLFLHKKDYSFTTYNSEDGVHIEKVYWEAIDDDFKGSIKCGDGVMEYELVVAEPIEKEEDGLPENDTVFFKIHPVEASNVEDWSRVIKSCISRSQNQEDKYPYIHLLWMLNFRQWDSEDVVNALNVFEVKTRPFIINVLNKVCKCLSVNKQQRIKDALQRFNHKYEIYFPKEIKEVLEIVAFLQDIDILDLNIYEAVDLLLEDDDQCDITRVIDINTKNPFLCLYDWLHCDESNIDYSTLISIYSLSSHKIQMDIVKRYFHDIRLNRTALDIQLVEQFVESDFAEFIRYRYCIFEPEEPVNLSVALLCDCVLTVIKTGGQSFQSFDGVMDFVMSHCDVTKPNVRLGLEELLPICDGGAVFNTSFCGFIDYSIVFELDESKFTENNLIESIRQNLNKKSKHYSYYACKYDGNRPLSEEQLAHCLSDRFVEENKQKCIIKRVEKRFECFTTCEDDNKWVVNDTDYDWLNNFLKEPLPKVDINSHPQKKYIIDLEQTSAERMENHIRSLVSEYNNVGDGRFLISSGQLRKFELLVQYSKPIFFRIIPQSQPFFGWDFDVLGVKKRLCTEMNISPLNASDELKGRFKIQEGIEIRKRVIETLKTELHKEEFNGVFFEVPYDRDLLLRIIGLYYFKYTIPTIPHEYHIRFLTRRNLYNFKQFCAPKLAETHNKATNLPFFWCCGLECFHNCLGKQTIENCSTWHDYSLYHFVEIVGYSMLRKTEAGFEPVETINQFVACANRAMKKFRRLKCRNCGHLMYTGRSASFNRHNYFSCINPTCAEYNHLIYLTYCFKCKKGLIDSRDSKQCSNGWYICPDCHSCCDDSLYERMAQRYILQNNPVPQRIQSKLGHGHNDKGLFFCHQCGTQLEINVDNGNGNMRCPQCNVLYERLLR